MAYASLFEQSFQPTKEVRNLKTRREFLKDAAASIAASAALPARGIPNTAVETDGAETSFTRWYDVDRSITNLENAYWNIMARPVMSDYLKKVT
jgi:hypothetical protein